MKELRKMKDESIEKKLNELRLELAKEMGQIKIGGNIKNPGRIKELRKAIARILTLKNEKKKRYPKLK